MDFINKLTHHDDGEAAHKPSSTEPSSTTSGGPPQIHATEAAIAKEDEPKRHFLEQLIAGSGGSHHHFGGGDVADDDERLSFFDKLTRKEDREKKMLELVKREAEVNFELEKVAREKKENEGLLERIKDHFDGDNDDAAPVAVEPKAENDDDSSKPSFFDKLTGKQEREKKALELSQRETALRAELARIEHDKRENEGILERIKQHIDQDEADGKDKKARDEDPSFFDKITGRAAEAERRRKEEEKKTPLEKMKDRIEEGMGGGQKAERNEDLLDKSKFSTTEVNPIFVGLCLCTKNLPTAIDGFQEHVLRKGDQSDESAIEQLKDEQIAAAIRNQLHLKKKEDE